MILALPIIMIFLFGFGISTEVKNAKIAFLDPSRDSESRAIINAIETSEYFSTFALYDQQWQVDEAFKKNEIGVAVIFPEKWAESVASPNGAQIQIIADGTDPNTANTLTNYISQIVMRETAPKGNGGSMTRAMTIVPEVKLLYNPTMKSTYNIVPGVMGMILMLICAMMTSISIAREKELGTMEVLLVSPLKPLGLILAKVIPYFTLSVINLATILVLAVFVLDVPIAGNFFLLIAVALLFIFVSLALGLFISTNVESQLVALLGSAMGLMLPAVMLSGLMFPIESMPWPLQIIAQLVPAKWFIEAMRDIMIKGLGFWGVAKEIGVLALMGTALVALSLKRFKIRLE
ncbi:MAG: ABC transporter permease [Schleiferiaceae bacterium]